jgi:uncharacterized membrane protein YfcA
MLTDPWFYAAAIVGTFLIGMSKSGFMPGIGAMGVPLMALTISPVQAAAIQLPILVATDLIGVWNYRRQYHWPNLRLLILPAFIGIAAGWATVAWVTDAHIRVVVGLIGVIFTLNYWFGRQPPDDTAPSGPDPKRAMFWGSLSSYTSFFAHSGGPPYAVYILPQRLPNTLYAGTTIMFFSLVNALKLPPYFMLGQLSFTNVATSMILFPVAWISTLIGIWLVRRVPAKPFYRILYATQFLVSLKLLWDGLNQLLR